MKPVLLVHLVAKDLAALSRLGGIAGETSGFMGMVERLASVERNPYHLARCAASGGGQPRAPGGPKPEIQDLQSAMLGGGG